MGSLSFLFIVFLSVSLSLQTESDGFDWEQHYSEIQPEVPCYGIFIGVNDSSTIGIQLTWPCRVETQYIPQIPIFSYKKIGIGLTSGYSYVAKDSLKNYIGSDSDFNTTMTELVEDYAQTIRELELTNSTLITAMVSTSEDTDEIREKIYDFLSEYYSEFFIDDSLIKSVDSNLEVAYKWIALNYLSGQFDKDEEIFSVIEVTSDFLWFAFVTEHGADGEEEDSSINTATFKELSKSKEFDLDYAVYDMGSMIALDYILTSKYLSGTTISSPCHPIGLSIPYRRNPEYTLEGDFNEENCLEGIVEFLASCSECSFGLDDNFSENSAVFITGDFFYVPFFFDEYVHRVKPSEINSTMTNFCQLTPEEILKDYKEHMNIYYYDVCFLGIYTTFLLTEVFEFDSSKNFLNQIKDADKLYQWYIGASLVAFTGSGMIMIASMTVLFFGLLGIF